MTLRGDDNRLLPWVRITLVILSVLSWLAILPALYFALGAFFLSGMYTGSEADLFHAVGWLVPALVLVFAVCVTVAATGRLRAMWVGAVALIGLIGAGGALALTV